MKKIPDEKDGKGDAPVISVVIVLYFIGFTILPKQSTDRDVPFKCETEVAR